MADQIVYQTSNPNSIFPLTRRSDNNEKASKLLIYIFLLIVILALTFLIVSLRISRISSPQVKITSVTVQDLFRGNLSFSSIISLVATLNAKITIRNRNHGRFQFDSCTAELLYENTTIGDGDITGGSVGRQKTGEMNITMNIGMLNLNSSDDDDSGTGTGVMKLQSYAEMRGRVKIFKTSTVIAEMNCSISLSLNNKSIDALQCR